MVLKATFDTGLSSSILVHEHLQSLIETDTKGQQPPAAGETEMSWVSGNDAARDAAPNTFERAGVDINRVTWGILCVYMAIGAVGDFFVTFLAAPTLCQYVFGPMGSAAGDHTTFGQCNVAPSVFQISWNFKLFFGFFLDLVPFFGSRRKGWILFGWTGGLVMLGVNAMLVDNYRTNFEFEKYLYGLMVMCIFYTFSDVAADGMVVELSKMERGSRKGYVMTTCQMARFAMMMTSTAFGTLAMSGPTYQPRGTPTPGALVLPFELSLSTVHWVLFAVALPLYVGMWVFLKDLPHHAEHGSICEGAVKNGGMVWQAMKSFAVFMLIVQCYGTNAIANLMNPANQAIASISKPSNIQTGIGSVIGNGLLVVGIWIFRKYLMGSSWRSTMFMSQFMLALTGALSLMSIYDTWGISRNGWFYMFTANVPSLIQGVGRVVGSLAIVEISPKGLEATVYELLVSANNGAISLNTAVQTVSASFFGSLTDISSTSWEKATAKERAGYEYDLMSATIFALIVNVTGALVFVWFLPKNAAQCKEWAAKPTWHVNRAAILNTIIFLLPFAYANYTTLSYISK